MTQSNRLIAKATILEWLELVLGFFASPNLLSEMLLLELVLGFALLHPTYFLLSIFDHQSPTKRFSTTNLIAFERFLVTL